MIEAQPLSEPLRIRFSVLWFFDKNCDIIEISKILLRLYFDELWEAFYGI